MPLKEISLLSLVLLCFISTESQVTIHGYKEKINGKVKTFTQTTYEAVNKFGNTQKGKITEKKKSYKFNSAGNETEYIDSNIFRKIVTTYDKKGTKSKLESKDRNNITFHIQFFTYDDKNNLTELNYYDKEGKLQGKNTYKYDERNNVIEQAEYKADGSISTKTTYSYDNRKNLIEKIQYGKEMQMLSSLKYVYDESNNKVKETGERYGDNKWKQENIIYDYDSIGNLIKETEIRIVDTKKEKAHGKTYTYNEKNKLIEVNQFYLDTEGNFVYTFKYTKKYNSIGQLIEESTIDLSQDIGKTYTNKYSNFDKNGNWLKNTYFYGFEPSTITERTIQYY